MSSASTRARTIDALEQAILRQDPSLVAESALPEPSAVCPYQGLKPYDLDDAELFFGRDSDIAACLRKLSDTSVLAVVGPSGCGKSSLVRAGVAAALRSDGRQVVVMTPGPHPVAALAAAMPGTGRRRRWSWTSARRSSRCAGPRRAGDFLAALTVTPPRRR